MFKFAFHMVRVSDGLQFLPHHSSQVPIGEDSLQYLARPPHEERRSALRSITRWRAGFEQGCRGLKRAEAKNLRHYKRVGGYSPH